MLPSNTTFDVYRGYAPAAPYDPPQRPAVLVGLKGYLHQHVRNGRFGYYPSWARAPLYWTTVLDVKLGTDGLDAYQSQLNADTVQNGDTVMVYDYPIPGTCCAFVVSFVQRRGRGTPGDLLRFYLDRAQPSWSQGCPDPTATGGGGGGGTIHTPCCSSPVAATLYATLSGIACLTGTYTLTWNGSNGWDSSPTIGICGSSGAFSVGLLCLSTTWEIAVTCGSGTGITSSYSGSCAPMNLTFTPVALTCGSSSGLVTVRVTS